MVSLELKLKLFLISTLSVLATTLSSQSIEVIVSADTVLIGNYIELAYVINDMDGKFSEPHIEGAEIISGPNVSSSVQIINGDRTSSQVYTYFIKPDKLGYINIGPASIGESDSMLECEPLELLVVPNPDNLIIEPDSRPDHNAFNFDWNWGTENPILKKETPTKRKFKRI